MHRGRVIWPRRAAGVVESRGMFIVRDQEQSIGGTRDPRWPRSLPLALRGRLPTRKRIEIVLTMKAADAIDAAVGGTANPAPHGHRRTFRI